MELKHLAGQTWYIPDATNIGVYQFDDRSCLLIDSGSGEAKARKILDLLEEQGLAVYGVFNTHAHADHCGGNQYLQANTGCRIFAGVLEKIFIENPIMLPAALYSAAPLKVLTNRFMMSTPSLVTDSVSEGVVTIKGVPFEVMDLSGHSIGQMGLKTPDQILFTGDCLMTEETISSYGFVYLLDLDKHNAALDRLRQIHCERYIPAHGTPIEELEACLKHNTVLLKGIEEYLLSLLGEAKSREEIISDTVRQYAIQLNSSQYYLISSTISAFLTHLYNQKMIIVKIFDGVLKFKIKNLRE